MRRALRAIRAGERAEEGVDLPFVAPRSRVEARSRAQQSRLERRSPTRTVALSFLVMIAVGTLLLMLPPMSADAGRTPLVTALFTATSSICVTGLNVVDPATHWSGLGKVTILVFVQVGGFGIQALGPLWILVLNRRVGTRSRMAAMTETGALTPGDVRRVLVALGMVTLIVEVAIAAALALRFWNAYDYGWGRALWYGVFHSISAFNNAGFALYSDSLTSLAADPLVIVPVSIAVVLGGLGFLVVVELVSRATGGRGLLPRRRTDSAVEAEDEWRGRSNELAAAGTYTISEQHRRLRLRGPIPLSLHTRLMLWGTAVLVVIGTGLFALLEWRNPQTLGPMGLGTKLLNAFFSGGVTPRTAGFNSIDYSLVGSDTRLLTDVLMFVGGGSGSTAGGVKVTTFMVLLAAALAEVRGRRDVETLDRRIPESTVRVAIAVLLVSGTAVVASTMAMIALTGLTLDLALFEIVSATATVGLSADVTPTLGQPAQLLLVALMFLGRVGPLTLASSLSLNVVHRSYRLPEGRPMVG